MNIIQVGSHKGYDDFTNIVKSYQTNQINFLLLIEPNSKFNDQLKQCYDGYNAIIQNIVIVDDDNLKNIKFYNCDENIYPDKPGSNYSELSSLFKENILKHYVKPEAIIEQWVECSTINNILEKYNLKELDILFIDTEGFDLKLIKSIDFDKYKIKKIYYENLHINNEEAKSFLTSNGYIINNNILYNGWTNEAIKIFKESNI